MKMFFFKSPSPAQIEAGNYKKKHIRLYGLDISIENRKGSVRKGIDKGGKEWANKMGFDYGYVRGSMGVDGDHVDCYIGPDKEADKVYVVHQRKAGDWGKFDEDKCMICFANKKEAIAGYLKQYNDKRFLGPVTTLSIDEFKKKVLATKDKPKMIKSVVFFKSNVKAHFRRTRGGNIVHIAAYTNTKTKQSAQASPRKKKATDFSGQSDLFDNGDKSDDESLTKDKLLFHGTSLGNDFDVFDDSKSGSGVGGNSVDQGDRIYLTENQNAAGYFAMMADDSKRLKETSAKHRKGEITLSELDNILDENGSGGSILRFGLVAGAKIKELRYMPRLAEENKEHVERVLDDYKRDGYDAVSFPDRGFLSQEHELASRAFENGEPPRTVIVLSPEKLKRI